MAFEVFIKGETHKIAIYSSLKYVFVRSLLGIITPECPMKEMVKGRVKIVRGLGEFEKI